MKLIFATLIIAIAFVARPALAQTNRVTSVQIPIEIKRGDLLVRSRVNGSQPLTFKLDTGFGINTLHPSLVEPLKLERAGQLKIIGIAGSEMASTFSGAVFDFGGATFSPRRVAVLASDARRKAANRAGILGADFFRRFVVEVDPVAKTMRLHEPKTFTYAGHGEIIPLEFHRDTPVIEAGVVAHGGAAVRGRFELDTGCDDCVCLGAEFVSANHILKSTADGKSSARQGVGGGTATRQTKLDQLQLGKLTVDQPSCNCFVEGSPASAGQVGHIGLGALQRFRFIFDYSRKRLILEAAR